MWKEFKKFAFKGNVLDMAVGVIMGGAFGKIVTSVVNDLIMPVLGFLMAGMDFKTMKYVMSPAVMDGETVVKAEAAILYGNFIQNVVDFLIVAVSIFIFVKLINKSKENLKKQEAPAPEAPKGPTQEELLAEIRDLLKEK
jgi:large conductance mechanosensitive channel